MNSILWSALPYKRPVLWNRLGPRRCTTPVIPWFPRSRDHSSTHIRLDAARLPVHVGVVASCEPRGATCSGRPERVPHHVDLALQSPVDCLWPTRTPRLGRPATAGQGQRCAWLAHPRLRCLPVMFQFDYTVLDSNAHARSPRFSLSILVQALESGISFRRLRSVKPGHYSNHIPLTPYTFHFYSNAAPNFTHSYHLLQ